MTPEFKPFTVLLKSFHKVLNKKITGLANWSKVIKLIKKMSELRNNITA